MFAGDLVNGFFIARANDQTPVFADSLPTVTVIQNITDTTVPVTVTQTAVTGQYNYAFTVPTSWVRGDEIHVRYQATINTLPVVSKVIKVGEVEQSTTSLSTADIQAIADEILKRGAANVDGVAEQNSLYSLIQAAFEATRSAATGTLTVKETDGATVHMTKAITTSSVAEPVTDIT